MKLIIFILSLLFFSSIIFAKEVTSKYQIQGMMCEMNCPGFIIEEASKLDGIKNCEVDFENGSAIITYDDEKVDKSSIANILSKNTDNLYKIKIKEDSSKSWWDWFFGS